jgi:hypothetical protein
MPKREPPKQPQSERFKEAARQLGCDEDEAAFDEKLRRIGKAKPQPPKDDVPKPRQPRTRSR